MKLIKNNRQIGAIQSFVWGIITIGVLVAVGLLVLSDLKVSADTTSYMCSGNTNFTSYNSSDDTCTWSLNASSPSATALTAVHSAAYNATGTLITKLATAPTWIGILIVVAFASAVLAYFYMQGRK